MLSKTEKIFLALYLFLSIITFGRASTNHQQWLDKECSTPYKRLIELGSDCYSEPTAVGLAWGTLWPLYWSREIWK